MHEKLRHHILGCWAAWVCRHPRTVLLVCLLTWAASVAVSALHLRFLPDRNELISPDLEWNRRYIAYRENFSFDELIVVVQSGNGPTGRRDAERFVAALAERLADDEHIEQVQWGFDENAVSAASVRLLPANDFEQRLRQMAGAGPLLQAKSTRDLFQRIRMEMVRSAAPDTTKAAPAELADQLDDITHVMRRLESSLRGDSVTGVFDPLADRDRPRWRYFEADEGKLLLMRIRPRPDASLLEPVTPAVEAVRAHLDEVRHAIGGVEAGMTGVPVIEADETAAVERDALLASVIAFILIAVLLVIAFHCWRIPMLVVAALLVGVGWTFGFLTLAIGHLQLLSVTFTVILLGLGVDFGIHLITRFELVRHQYGSDRDGFEQAMVDVFQTTGPGMITGALTTALAFGTTLLTDFRGMAEMGLIAGVGILLCLLAMFTVLPVLMRLTRPRKGHIIPLHKRRLSIYQHHWWQPMVNRPWLPLIVVAILLAGAGTAWPPRYDYDLSKLLPERVESVHWFKRLEQAYHSQRPANEDGESVGGIWFGALPISDLDFDTARRRTQALRDQPSVLGVGGAGWLFPDNEPNKLARMAEVKTQLGDVLTDAPKHEVDTPAALRIELQVLGLMAQQGVDRAADAPAIAEALQRLAEQILRTDRALQALPGDRAARRLAEIQSDLVDLQKDTRRRLNEALEQRPMRLDDLPAVLRDDAVGGQDRDKLLLRIYPRANVYDPASLETFVNELLTVDPQTTGTVVQIYKSNQLIINAYINAAIYALIAVFLIVLLDFQSIVDALLCLLPVAVAFVLLLGLMGVLGIPVNPANVIILPLLFGMGVDSGVHMVHRYRMAREEHPPGLAGGTGKGITMTGLTTMIGFAALMVAAHRGIFSLGLVLTLGMALTLGVCLAVMPAILELRGRLCKAQPGNSGNTAT